MRFPTTARSWSSLLLPSTEMDYAVAAGDGRHSSIIMACVLWAARVFPEAPLRVQEMDTEGQTRVVPGHPMQYLIENPNPFYSGIVLWMATLVDFLIDGNAYWIKIRNIYGDVIQLWWVPCTIIEPKWPDLNTSTANTKYITHYEYRPDPHAPDPVRLPPEDVVHFRYGIDPHNVRKGLAPIANLLREIFTDNEAANFSASLLKNLGVPGVILSPGREDAEAGVDDLEEAKEVFMRRFGGDKRGEPMMMRTKTDVKVLSFSPQQMDLRSLRRIPEERSTAVLGIPAIVVGLGAGLERSTFANFAEAREAAFESFIAPLQRLISAELTLKLLPDFENVDEEATTRRNAYFDVSGVRILAEDISRKSKYLTAQFEGGIITRSEARRDLGHQVTDADNVYRLPKAVLEVPSDKGGVPYLEDLIASGSGGFGEQDGGKPAPKAPQ